jgi:hypothetical protein
MSVGGVRYSSEIYGDSLDKSNFLVRGTKKRRDKNMMAAFERRIPVLVTLTRDGRPRLPKVIGVGTGESVRDVAEGLREFRINFRRLVAEGSQKDRLLTRNPDDKKPCWIKRAFLNVIGLTCRGNLMECSLMCDLVGRPAPACAGDPELPRASEGAAEKARVVANKGPSPPKNMDFRFPARSMLYSIPGEKATIQPVSTRSFSPLSSRSTIVPPAWTKALPSPLSFCRMNPSPPKKPAPSLRLKAIVTWVP